MRSWSTAGGAAGAVSTGVEPRRCAATPPSIPRIRRSMSLWKSGSGRMEVPLRKDSPPQALRQFVGPRDRRIADQHGDDRDLAAEGGLDLDPDEVARVVEPAIPARSGDREPSVPDYGQEDLAAGDLLGQDLAKILTQRDRIDVLEDLRRDRNAPRGDRRADPPGGGYPLAGRRGKCWAWPCPGRHSAFSAGHRRSEIVDEAALPPSLA